MNKKFTLSAIVAMSALMLTIASCKKGDVVENPVTPPPVTSGSGSTSIYYLDTFRLYSTDLSGGNRKLLVDEDLKSQNNYMGSFSIMPTTGKIVYSYTTGYLNPPVIKIANADGSGAKVIKTLAVGAFINFVKGIVDNKIYYSTSVYANNTTKNTFYVMNDDGTGEKELTELVSFASLRESAISREGKGFLANDGYFVRLKDGKFDELNSYMVLTNEPKTVMSDIAMSSDATKIAWVAQTTTADKYEIRVKDISTKGTSSTIAYTYTTPTTGPAAITGVRPAITWLDGNKRLLLSYGKNTSPKGAPSDYIYCVIIDPATSALGVNWSFTGDGTAKIIAN